MQQASRTTANILQYEYFLALDNDIRECMDKQP